MNDNIKAGAEIMGGDGEYSEGTKEAYESFVKERNKSLGTARIKELSDIAYKNHLARNPNSSFGRRSDYDKEFAELIIRECADICINENVSNLDLKVMRESGKFTVQDLATKSCGENLAKRIKERFGILDQEN
jgi:hypothetical protein